MYRVLKKSRRAKHPHHITQNFTALAVHSGVMFFHGVIWDTDDIPFPPTRMLDPASNKEYSKPTKPELGTLGVLPLEIRLSIWNLLLEECSQRGWPCWDGTKVTVTKAWQ